MRPERVTLRHIARDMLLKFHHAPWLRKGPEPFGVCIRCQIDGERLDDLLVSVTDQCVSDLLAAERSNERVTGRRIGLDGTLEQFDGTTCSVERVHGDGGQVYLDIHLDYVPQRPDRQMPVFFWLGELAEAA